MKTSRLPFLAFLASTSLLPAQENSSATCRTFFPFHDYGAVLEPQGELLGGTAGTVGGRREPEAGAPRTTPFVDLWHGAYFLGGDGAFGPDLRGRLLDRGVKLESSYQGAFFGVVAGEKGARGFWNQQLNASGEINFGKVLDNEVLKTVSGFAGIRYRDGWPQSNPNEFVGANSMFNPSNWQSGTQFRVTSFGLFLDSGKHLPVEKMLTLQIGWLQPQKSFMDQPLSKLFLNNAVNGAKGVGGNIPFSSSFSTWGGVLTIRPLEELYLRGGLYMSYPEATASQNHGLAFAGFAQNPSQNGLFTMNELGWTPRFGPSRLPGKYAFGGYYYGMPGNQTTTWSNGAVNGLYGFYFQLDQMLYREPAAPETPSPADGKSLADGRSVKGGGSPAHPGELSEQGLKTFNLITFTPGTAKKNVFPFYFQSGLVYTGLFPGRGDDLAMISLGLGAYQNAANAPDRSYTAVIEGGYRYQINGWSYAQPFAQYFIRPDGTGDVANAAVFGFLVGVVF